MMYSGPVADFITRSPLLLTVIDENLSLHCRELRMYVRSSVVFSIQILSYSVCGGPLYLLPGLRGIAPLISGTGAEYEGWRGKMQPLSST